MVSIYWGLKFAGLATLLLALSPTARAKKSGGFSIPTDNFCNATKANDPSLGRVQIMQMCALIGTLEKLITLMKPVCSDDSLASILPPISTSITGQPLPSPILQNMRPMQPYLNEEEMAQAEGADYYWYFRVIHNLELWAPCKVANSSLPDTFLPPGWSLVGDVINVGAPVQLDGVSWPFAYVMLQGGKMVIVIRGTHSTGEWLMDFTYNHSSNALLAGATHAGFTQIAKILWKGGVKSALDQLVKSHGANLFSLTVTGHSLGAGVSTLLAAMAAKYLKPKRMHLRSDFQVDAVLFAPPEAGDAEFAAKYDHIVNSRSIKFANDIVPQIPCTPQVFACPKTPVPTGPLGTSWAYESVGGQIMLSGANFPVQPDAWSGFSTLPLKGDQVNLFFHASHTCSYSCYFARFTNDENNLCGLWEDDAVTSYCAGYPYPGYPAQA